MNHLQTPESRARLVCRVSDNSAALESVADVNDEPSDCYLRARETPARLFSAAFRVQRRSFDRKIDNFPRPSYDSQCTATSSPSFGCRASGVPQVSCARLTNTLNFIASRDEAAGRFSVEELTIILIRFARRSQERVEHSLCLHKWIIITVTMFSGDFRRSPQAGEKARGSRSTKMN